MESLIKTKKSRKMNKIDKQWKINRCIEAKITNIDINTNIVLIF